MSDVDTSPYSAGAGPALKALVGLAQQQAAEITRLRALLARAREGLDDFYTMLAAEIDAELAK